MTENHDLASYRGAEKEDKSNSKLTFEFRITSTFTAVRDDIERTAMETHIFADKILRLLSQVEESHLRKNAGFQVMREHSSMNKGKFDGLLSTYSLLMNELGPRHVHVVEAGEQTTWKQSIRMRKSRKGIMDAAKRHLDESREKQQLATDASELMKHYKALITAT